MRLRRAWLGALLLLGMTGLAAASPVIIDHAFDTRPHLEKLKRQGVLAIGRYYARCVREDRLQWDDKRMSPAEVDALMAQGFAILSIYQYWNNNAIKFDGLRRDWQGNVAPTLDAGCNESAEGRSAAEEGRLDAEAALRQARAVGQPQGTAIYFGVDFDFPYKAAERRDYTAKMLDYFGEVHRILSAAGYRTGSYGNGYAHRVLREAGLVELTWLSPSSAHSGSIDYYRNGDWALFQSNVDIGWFADGACKGMYLDTNVQNPNGPEDIGLWRREGPVTIPRDVTVEVFGKMRFVCDAKANIRDAAGSWTGARICKRRAVADLKDAPHGQSVVIGARRGDLVEIDLDHDGVADGWTKALNLSDSMMDRPEYIRRAPSPYCR
ncbi:MAG: DUF1906 domain-containing protein [Pseudomonadota bacterium]